MPIRGVRGATVVAANNREEIVKETQNLLEEMISANQILPEEIASIFFSVTPDLDAEFPAVAARKMGLMDTPLLCLNEIPVPHGLANCIRILIHVNTPVTQAAIQHVYLKEAVSLRPDHAR